MTVADQIRQEGLYQGIHQGMHKGAEQEKMHIVQNMLSKGLYHFHI